MTQTVGAKRTACGRANDKNNRALQEIRRRRGNHPEGGTPLDLTTKRSGTNLNPQGAHAEEAWAEERLAIMRSLSTIFEARILAILVATIASRVAVCETF